MRVIGQFDGGETRSAYLLADSDEREWVLKWSAVTAETDQRRLVRWVERLRDDGYPAPARLTVGVIDGVAYGVQGKGDLAQPGWTGWLLDTIDRGADGYCVHETVAGQPETAKMLQAIKSVARAHRR